MDCIVCLNNYSTLICQRAQKSENVNIKTKSKTNLKCKNDYFLGRREPVAFNLFRRRVSDRARRMQRLVPGTFRHKFGGQRSFPKVICLPGEKTGQLFC